MLLNYVGVLCGGCFLIALYFDHVYAACAAAGELLPVTPFLVRN